jgi:ribosomal protein S18 acetylase RimI-like enzyme
MSDFLVRPVERADVAELAALLNAIIARGGTTAFETPFEPDVLADRYLLGPDVFSARVASTGDGAPLAGFQIVLRSAALPDGWGDIGTFTRIGGTQRGVGRALFHHTERAARARGLISLNATIRADNTGGLAYYSKLGFVDYNIKRAIRLQSGALLDRIEKRYALT